MGNVSRGTSKKDSSLYEEIILSRAKYLNADLDPEEPGVELTVLDGQALRVNPRLYEFPFENVVLEGGGNKGLAYCGAVRVLEELGIWPQVKRIAGTSCGAMTAALLAVGYTSREIQTFLSQDLSSVLLDHVCGVCSIPINVKLGYGWNPGRKIVNWFKRKLEHKTKNGDITFKMLNESNQKTFIKELCIVVTNINEMTAEYCHVKTHPHMKIVDAVRMSMSLPGIYQAFEYKHNGVSDIMVDGGILCNYPINCFDGWWLSMDEGNSFMERLHPMNKLPELYQHSKRFGDYNDKTLGFVLFEDDEQDVFRFELEKRFHMPLEELAGTKLSDEHHEKKQKAKQFEKEHEKLVHAVENFLKSVRNHNTHEDRSTINNSELLEALIDKDTFPTKDRQLIFGDVDNDRIIQYLDKSGDGKIQYRELVAFVEEAGVQIRTRTLGYSRKEVNGVMDFVTSLISTVTSNAKKAGFKISDLARTVAINTGHVGTFDFVLEEEDRDFVVNRGRQATLTFLKYYVVSNNLPKKGSHEQES